MLAVVEINPESHVRVRPGLAKPALVEAGTRLFLVKVINQAGVTAGLRANSPNALPVYVQSDGSAEPTKEISPADIRDRWHNLYDKDPRVRAPFGPSIAISNPRNLQPRSRDNVPPR